MKPETPPTILLSNYKPTPYEIVDLHLDFSLEPRVTRVKSRIEMTPRDSKQPLVFSGEKLKLNRLFDTHPSLESRIAALREL